MRSRPRHKGGGKAVSGIVKDDTGNPLIGVTVTVPGTTKGTTTDANGTYTINADNSESLNFSYVGYKPQTIHVNNQSTIDVTMSEDNTSLEEVVVVGYGVQKRRDIVGAVETLSTKGLEERMGSSMSISRSLQGAIPGLTMTFSDGKPNRGATVRIRGAENSIGSGGSALVMVDGVETDMSTVNPDDIEPITVLKDASSPTATIIPPRSWNPMSTHSARIPRTSTTYSNSRAPGTTNWHAATATPRMRNGASTTATSTNTSATPTGTTYSTRTIRPDTSTTSA